MVISVNGFVITNWWLHSMYKKKFTTTTTDGKLEKSWFNQALNITQMNSCIFFSPWARDFCLLVAIIKNIWRINWENIFSMKFFCFWFFSIIFWWSFFSFFSFLLLFFSFSSSFFLFFSFFSFFSFFLFFLHLFWRTIKNKMQKKIDAVVVKHPKILLWWAKKRVVLCRWVHYMLIPLHMSTVYGL